MNMQKSVRFYQLLLFRQVLLMKVMGFTNYAKNLVTVSGDHLNEMKDSPLIEWKSAGIFGKTIITMFSIEVIKNTK